MSPNIERREFLKQVTAGLVGGAVAPALLGAECKRPTTAPAVGTLKDLPKRKLGRLGLEVPGLSFGTAAMGHAFYEPEPFEEVINAAIDAGVFYMDSARLYDIAEERLAPILAKRRKEVFLVTKTWAKSKDECLKSLDKSLSLMKVDHVDLCHMHNVGQYTQEEALGKNGLLEGLQEARKRGLIKHIGCTGHMVPGRFIPIIETGEIEVLMVAMNYVDHHTYNFEEKVLPIAQKHNIGIICMKVLGGVSGGWDGYKNKRPGRLVGPEDYQDAFDYALSIPGVATCVVGIKSLDELRQAIQAVRSFKPLVGERREKVLAKGAKLAAEWGPHFGPVV